MNEGSSREEEIWYIEREDTRVRHATTLQYVGSLLNLDYAEQWDFNYSDIVTLCNIRTVFYKKECKCTSKAKEHIGNRLFFNKSGEMKFLVIAFNRPIFLPTT